MSVESSDPTEISTVVVTAEDLTSALETNRTSGQHAVLRITPPFSGRMRARLHVELDEEYEQEPEPIHVEPRTLVADSLPPYPRPAETEDELRADPDREYTVERHHEYHASVVERWRQRVPDAVKSTATIETAAGPTDIEVSVLGRNTS
ncbi:hypothetical protein GRX03_14685 [Halovenus sp. WSH3]|uniref:DUF8009 domain-containing protein n=1 Tax=Halovenus carboxidivorans TaxID=2692199 RepID=A0A6B0T7C1_9EURY|nr:hypothetical protein [Halovenus carboxidivorans]MXR52847.1 hypothetical protein [Halovenus carboxidivorans]